MNSQVMILLGRSCVFFPLFFLFTRGEMCMQMFFVLSYKITVNAISLQGFQRYCQKLEIGTNEKVTDSTLRENLPQFDVSLKLKDPTHIITAYALKMLCIFINSMTAKKSQLNQWKKTNLKGWEDCYVECIGNKKIQQSIIKDEKGNIQELKPENAEKYKKHFVVLK